MEVEFSGTERFEIRGRLGSGGMGVVYEAYDRDKKSAVALKTLRQVDAQSVYRLKREFRALQGLKHPNLVGLGELIETHGSWFFTMELVRGANFLSYVRPERGATEAPVRLLAPDAETGRLDDDTSAHVGKEESCGFDETRLRNALGQLAQGLAALHAAKKIHRDVKPSNILVDPSGRVVLLDFGLITETGPDRESTELHVVGTASYMAPEQAAEQPLGPEADWYGVGVILYQALTGQLPFSGPALRVLLDKQMHDPRPPRDLAPNVPDDLDALCTQLLRRAPEERPTDQEILTRLDAEMPAVTTGSTTDLTQTPPFIGRERDLEMLQRAFEDVNEGEAITVYVHGSSGVGKSALIQEFVHWASEECAAVVLAGRCYEQESVPYKALDGVVDALSRHLRRLRRAEAIDLVPNHGAFLPRIFPVLGRVEVIAEAPVPARAPTDPHETRRRAFAALRELFDRMTEWRPVVLVIDDLQWADLDSYVLLQDILRPPHSPPLLLLVSSRETRAVAEKRRQAASPVPAIPGEVRHLELDALPPPRAEELARLLLERAGLEAAENARSIATEAAGHPLYIDELVRHALSVERKSSEPVRLDDAIWRRASDLPGTTREVLEIVCLAAAPLPQAIIRQAARLDKPDFNKHLSVLRVARLVNSRGLRDHDPVEPYHNRVREAVTGNLDERKVRERHRRLAVALRNSEVTERRPDILVHHLAAIGRSEEAASYAESGASRATSALAFDRAVVLLREAVRLRAISGKTPSALRAALGYALCMAGQQSEAATVYLEAARTAPAALSLEYRRRAADAYLVSGHLDEGLEALRIVLRSANLPLPRRSGWRALLAMVAMRARLRARGLRFKVRDTTEVSAQELRRTEVCWSAAAGLALVDTVRGVEYSTRHLLFSLRSGVRRAVAKGLGMEAGYASSRGRRGARRSAALIAEMKRLAGDDEFIQAWHRGAQAFRSYELAQFPETMHLSREALQEFESMSGADVTWELVNMRLWNLWSLYYTGSLGELSRRVDHLLRDAIDRGDLYSATNFCTSVPSAAWLVRDEPQRMREQADEHMARWSRESFHLQHYWHFYALQNGLLYTRDIEGLSHSLGHDFRNIVRSWVLRLPFVRMELFDLRARTALALASTTRENAALLRRAERDARRTERTKLLPAASALAHLTRASVAFLRGDQERTRQFLSLAAGAADLASMAAHAAAARRRLGEIVGGDKGAALIAASDTWMKEQGVVAPAKLTRMLTPAFETD